MKNKCDVNGRKNGRKSKILSYIYIGFEKRGNITVLYILHGKKERKKWRDLEKKVFCL